MKLGYARVSTEGQSLDPQTDALTNAGVDPAAIWTDVASGKLARRPGLDAMLKAARPGDGVVVTKLDRLGRSLKDLLDLAEDLRDRHIDLISLSDKIDTTTAGGKLVFHVLGAVAEFERGLISERTKAGLDAARKRGRTGGRPQRLNALARGELARLYLDSGGQVSVRELAARYNVAPGTAWRAIEEARKAEQERGAK